ncbi:creatininase family protein [Acidocella sp.]|uniref:creatininase family protein n=1 Tax=Acidocella sp. TaxID=50710 RepID=UPI00263868E6|nr:creatininase family protein [Acidocella sp.]
MSPITLPPRLGDLTAPAFAALIPARPVILLPLGSQENHGPHLPMGDYLTADLLAARIATTAQAQGVPALAAPGLPFGVADYFGSSPGGLALSPATFKSLLTELLESLLAHGVENILILNAHGGNVPVIHEVTLAIRRARGLALPSFYLWKVAREIMAAQPGIASARFAHGAEPLASLTLALRPATTQSAAHAPTPAATLLGLEVSNFGALTFQGLTIEAPAEFTELSTIPLESAWPEASAALGQQVADRLVETAAAFAVHIHRHGTRAP